jgi:hypothetical protein
MTTLGQPMPSILTDSAAVPDSLFTPRPDELLIAPVTFSPVVQGVSLSVPVSVLLSLQPDGADGSQIRINARAFADLADLQHKIGALIDTVPLPQDNCQHFGVDNFVARIWGKQITVDGNLATLTLNGDIDNWTCAKNPIPCTKFEGFNLIFYDCNPPVKNKNFNQPFDATLPFQVVVADPQTVELRLGNPAVTLGGTLGGVTQGILTIAGVDISAKAQQLLAGSIPPDLLRQTLPADLLSLNPQITRAELTSHSGDLALYAEMTASLDGKAIGEMIGGLFLGA